MSSVDLQTRESTYFESCPSQRVSWSGQAVALAHL